MSSSSRIISAYRHSHWTVEDLDSLQCVGSKSRQLLSQSMLCCWLPSYYWASASLRLRFILWRAGLWHRFLCWQLPGVSHSCCCEGKLEVVSFRKPNVKFALVFKLLALGMVEHKLRVWNFKASLLPPFLLNSRLRLDCGLLCVWWDMETYFLYV